MSRHKLVDPDGVRVCAEMCPTCIFRPGNLMMLNPGTVKEMVDEAIAKEGSIVCHDTLDLPANAICRGFWDSYRDRVQLLTVADRIGFVNEIPHDPTIEMQALSESRVPPDGPEDCGA